MTHFEHLIGTMLNAVVVHSPTRYSWFGRPSPRLPRTVAPALTAEGCRQYLLSALQNQLYVGFYCRGVATRVVDDSAAELPGDILVFTEKLSAANTGNGYVARGWAVRRVESDTLVLRRNGFNVCATPADCLMNEVADPVVGATVALRLPKEYRALSPGFYVACGDNDIDGDTGPLVRVYWNLAREGAARFLNRMTRSLNRERLAFRLKVLNVPARFGRCDAAVLYLPADDVENAWPILSELYLEVAGDLRELVPALTKRIARGVGVAENPAGTESFGLHRCRLLAEAVVLAFERGARTADDRLSLVRERFAEEGIDIARPYLNPGSSDRYDLSVPSSSMRVSEVRVTRSRHDWLQAAHAIGRDVAQQALWHENRCTWIGAESGPSTRSGGQERVEHRVLGPDLYGGTAGVSIFLAELHAAVRDAALRKTAIGAMMHALSRLDSVDPRVRISLYLGWIGIAYAAARVGTLLASQELLDAAKTLLRRSVAEGAPPHFDLIAGKAGAIAGMIALQPLVNDDALLLNAMRLGDTLIGQAQRSASGYSWSAPGLTAAHLTGLSHGAAGAAYALLEIFDATGEVRFRHAADRAFEYEAGWFDPAVGNWPDLREYPFNARRSNRALEYCTFWCHGAPGIGLSRLRATEITRSATRCAEAKAAVTATRIGVEGALETGTSNYSLCHGLAGNAEVLLEAERAWGKASHREREVAEEVAAAGVRRFGESDGPWPCGSRGVTPGMMLGLAGIGYFYLRLHDRTIPSVLLPTRNSLAIHRRQGWLGLLAASLARRSLGVRCPSPKVIAMDEHAAVTRTRTVHVPSDGTTARAVD